MTYLIFLFYSFQAQAQFIEPPRDSVPYIQSQMALKSEEEPKFSEFFKEVWSLLPSKIQNTLSSHWPNGIPVYFEKIGGEISLENYCDSASQHTLGGSETSQNRIVIHSFLVTDILLGRNQLRNISCRHGNLYSEAQAVLIHELVHFYDEIVHLSSKTQFLDLNSFYINGRSRHKRIQVNREQSRSVDTYEWTSPAEALAVNLEYFILDPQFSTRKPAVNLYLSHELSLKSAPSLSNQVFVQPDMLSEKKPWIANLDFNRLYQIHYLLADPGQEQMSRFGHSMLRLVFCREGRPKGPSCLTEDLDQHLVLSFRANLSQTAGFSMKKLILGKAPSQLFVLEMSDVITEYNQDEFRNLVSLPLLLTEEEQLTLLQRSLEQFWSYVSNYSLLKTNCATEVLNLIRASVSDLGPSLKPRNRSPLTPKGVLRELIRRGRIAPNLVNSQGKPLNPESAEKQGYFFSAKKLRLKENFKALKKHPLFRFKNLENYLTKSSTDNRSRSYEAIQKTQPKLVGHFLVLEDHLIRRRFNDLIKKFIKRIQIKNAFENEIADFQKITASLDALQLPEPGYGVPLIQQWETRFNQLHLEINQMNEIVEGLLKTNFSKELQELQSAKALKDRFLKDVRKLIFQERFAQERFAQERFAT